VRVLSLILFFFATVAPGWVSAQESINAWWVPSSNPGATPVENCNTVCNAIKPGSICYAGGAYDTDTCTIGGATGTPVYTVARTGCPSTHPTLSTVPNPNTCTAVVTNPCLVKSGTSAGSGYLPESLGSAVSVGCDGQCEYVVNQASNGYRAMVNGVVTNYVKGSWSYSGVQCTATTGSVAASMPSNTCAAGQYAGTVNGKFTCITSNGSEASSMSPSNPTTTTSSDVVDNGNGTSTRTTTTTYSDNTTTTTTTTINNSTGQPISETTQGETPEEKDRAAAEQLADELPSMLEGQKATGQDTLAALGLPFASNPYGAFETSDIGAAMPGSNGTCVPIVLNAPIFGVINLNPCPVVTVMTPIVDYAIVALAAIAAMLAVLGARPQEA